LAVEYYLDTLLIDTAQQTGIIVTAGDTTVVDVGTPDISIQVEVYTITGIYDTPGEANGVFVDDTLAYTADGCSGLRIIDISDVDSPVEIGFFDEAGSARDVEIQGDTLLAAYWIGGLRIADVSNPAAPQEMGYFDTIGYAGGVCLHDSTAYIANGSIGV